MGPTALLQVGNVEVLVSSRSSYDWADEQFRSVGVDPLAVKFLVVKNPMNYKLAYGEAAKAAFILDTPGPTPATLRSVEYRNMRRPYFPLDEEIEGLKPRIFHSKPAWQEQVDSKISPGHATHRAPVNMGN